MQAFLTLPELELLTGYDSAGWQLRWLKQNGIHIYKVNSKGQPVVRRSDVEGRKKEQTNAPQLEKVT